MKTKFSIVLIFILLSVAFVVPASATEYDMTYEVEGGKLYFDSLTGEIVGADRTITSAVIPGHINGIDVTCIAEKAFYSCSKLEDVIVSSGVLAIQKNAFEECTNLKEVMIEEGLEIIGLNCFVFCYNLEKVTVPASLVSMGYNAVPEGTTIIYGYSNSASEEYSMEWGLDFVPLGRVQTVEFDYNGGVTSGIEYGWYRSSATGAISIYDKAISVETGNCIPQYPEPRKAGYKFAGWIVQTDDEPPAGLTDRNEGVDVMWDTNLPITEDMVLKAKWIIPSVVSFNYNGGTDTAGKKAYSVEVNTGEALSSYPTPVREGYEFAGWFSDYACTKPWQTSTPVTQSLTLYAKWLAPFTPSLDNFVPVSNYYGQFKDVTPNAWYRENVATAYELGLMKGSSDTTFNVRGNVTIAEAITMAARLHSIYFTGTENFVQSGNVWYQTYVTYATQNGITTHNYNSYSRAITRGEFAEIFSNAFPSRALELRNYLADGDIPDVKIGDDYWESIYCLYRAGILTGSDKKGTFYPNSSISRPEAAAIVTRMADPDLRKSFALEKGLTMVDYAGMTVSEVADVLGWDFLYEEDWWFGASKAFYYPDDRVPYIFFFTDYDMRGYALGYETVDIVDFFPANGQSCFVAPGIPSNLTYNQIVNLGLSGELDLMEEGDSEMGSTSQFRYEYNENILILFSWYDNHSPYTFPAENVTVSYHR